MSTKNSETKKIKQLVQMPAKEREVWISKMDKDSRGSLIIILLELLSRQDQEAIKEVRQDLDAALLLLKNRKEEESHLCRLMQRGYEL